MESFTKTLWVKHWTPPHTPKVTLINLAILISLLALILWSPVLMLLKRKYSTTSHNAEKETQVSIWQHTNVLTWAERKKTQSLEITLSNTQQHWALITNTGHINIKDFLRLEADLRCICLSCASCQTAGHPSGKLEQWVYAHKSYNWRFFKNPQSNSWDGGLPWLYYHAKHLLLKKRSWLPLQTLLILLC